MSASAFLLSTDAGDAAGLEAGLAAGEEAIAGVAAGVLAAGLLSVVDVHAAPSAAIAAKTVNRIDLLIVFPFVFDRRASFRGSRDRNLEAAPAGH